MTDQPTATDQPAVTREQMAAEDTGSARPAAADQPAGTRELRDAQASGERAAAEPRARRTATASTTSQRPPIKAVDGNEPTQARQNAPLFDEGAGRRLRERWLAIQTEFVDEPREAVQKADALVAEVLRQLTDTFAREREELEAGWSSSGDASKREISTEDLRLAIQRYRSFFNRLLAL